MPQYEERLCGNKGRIKISWRGHTTHTQGEASREAGRECGCGVAVGFGGDRGRRGGLAWREHWRVK
jgi:hypothetical protein